MATERQTKDALILAFEHLKNQQTAMNLLLSEVCAIRDSLIDAGRKNDYETILSRYRGKSQADNALKTAADVQEYDAIIQKLRNLP